MLVPQETPSSASSVVCRPPTTTLTRRRRPPPAQGRNLIANACPHPVLGGEPGTPTNIPLVCVPCLLPLPPYSFLLFLLLLLTLFPLHPFFSSSPFLPLLFTLPAAPLFLLLIPTFPPSQSSSSSSLLLHLLTLPPPPHSFSLSAYRYPVDKRHRLSLANALLKSLIVTALKGDVLAETKCDRELKRSRVFHT